MDNFNYVLCSPNFTRPVGIGTNPSTLLHMYSTAASTKLYVENNNAAGSALIQYRVANPGFDWNQGIVDTGTGRFGITYVQGSTEALSILRNGYLGIGISNPARGLHVYGASGNLFKIETGSGSKVVEVQSNANAQTAINFLNSSGNAQGQIAYQQRSGNDYMRFTTSATERIRIDSSGNVGIGTTSPSYTLQVNGSVAGTSAYNNLSDIRLKKNVRPIINALSTVEKLRGVRFTWRPPLERDVGEGLGIFQGMHLKSALSPRMLGLYCQKPSPLPTAKRRL